MLSWRYFAAIAAAMLCGTAVVGGQTNSQRPPITGIARVSVYASDLEKAQQFYGTFLGFPQIATNAKTVPQEYRVNSVQSIQVEPLPGGETDDLAYVAFATSDVKALRRYLLGKNVPVDGEIRTGADGSHLLWVKDPEGHRIQFVQLPKHRHLLPSHAAKTLPDKEQPVSRHILHAGFIVHDRAAEDRFYQDVLGFHVAWYGGMVEGRTDFVDMQVPDGTDWLEYMLHSSSTPTAAESGVLNHFALGVSNIHQAADLLQQRGWHSSPRSNTKLGRDGKWQLNLYDPNGTRVELMEFVPARTPCCSPYTLKAPAPQR